MTTLADARNAIASAMSKIAEQRMNPATTTTQDAALVDAMTQLLPKLNQIEIAQLDESAAAVAAATAGLQTVIDDTRLDTLSQLMGQLRTLRRRLDDRHT
jgi:hypothetical protein